MRQSKFYFLLLTVFFSISSNPPLYAQEDFCLTTSEGDILEYLGSTNSEIKKASGDNYARIYFHIIRKSDGTGGRTIADVRQMLENLRTDFASYDIHFQLQCIDYIDNDDFYSFSNGNEFGSQVFNIIGTNNHTDGIDIYVYSEVNDPNSNEDDVATGLAETPSIFNYTNFRSFIIIGGTSDASDKIPAGIDLALSRALPHEMGHCFGLHHTHRGTCEFGACDELVDGSNSLICGDLVEDTPADPHMDFNVNPVTCVWNGCAFGSVSSGQVCHPTPCSPVDLNGDSYNPLTDNYMSYTVPSCMSAFTDSPNKYSQVDKMLQTIEMHPGLKGVFEDNPVHNVNWFDDITLPTGTTVWNQPRHIFGTVTIPVGARLEITGLPSDETVISFIGNNARIVVERGGRLFMNNAVLNNSCLEGEYWNGVRVKGNSNVDHPANYPSNGSAVHGIVEIRNSRVENSLNGIHATGGIISALDSEFINNRIGVSLNNHFARQASHIVNNVFTINRAFPRPTSNDYRQVVGSDSRGLLVFNNQFLVDETNGPVGITTAVRVINSPAFIGGLSAVNTFTNFFSAVEVFNPFIALPVFIDNNIFTNNQHGITLNNTPMPNVRNNLFTIPDGTATSDAYGVLTYFSQGLNIEGNDFITAFSNETKGLVVINNESLDLINADGWVFDNNFNGVFAAGSQFERDNTGLIMQCNRYTGSTIDWYLANTVNVMDRLRQQGTCNSPPVIGSSVEEYGFWGKWSTDTSGDDIVNNSDVSNFTIQYDPIGYVEAKFSGGVTQTPCADLTDGSSDSGCVTGGLVNQGDIDPIITTIHDLLEDNDIDGVINELEDIDAIWAYQLLVGTYWYLRNETKALEVLNGIALDETVNIAFHELYTILILTGDQLPTSIDEQTIYDYTNNPDARISSLAEAILAYYYGHQYNRYSLPIPSNSSKQANTSLVSNLFKIVPNPALDYIDIVLSPNQWAETSITTVSIADMTGRILKEISINDSSVNIDIQDFASGIYFITLKENNKIRGVEKLIVTE